MRNREQDEWQYATDALLTNVSQFRADAADAAYAYTPQERRTIFRIEMAEVTGYDLFVLWQDVLKVSLKQLASKAESASFLRNLARDLQLTAEQAEEKALQIVDERIEEKIKQVVSGLYGEKRHKTQREAASEVLLLPEDEIQSLCRHYVAYTTYVNIAHQYGVTIFDPHASWPSRVRARGAIKREAGKLRTAEQKRLAELAQIINTLRSNNGRLIELIDSAQVDVVAVLAARTEYEKKLSKLTPADAQNPVMQMDIYTRVTKSLREEYGDRARTPKKAPLKAAQGAVHDIDQVLIRIFDLSNAEKNQLLSQMKEYRERTKEKHAILLAQQERSRVKNPFHHD